MLVATQLHAAIQRRGPQSGRQDGEVREHVARARDEAEAARVGEVVVLGPLREWTGHAAQHRVEEQ